MKDGFNAAFKAHRELGKSYSAEYKMGAWWAFQHQQAKVEELQTHAQEIHKREIKLFEKTLILTHERDELQKRVDAAKHYLGNIFTGNSIEDECHLKDLLDILDGKIVEELEQALKGGLNEAN